MTLHTQRLDDLAGELPQDLYLLTHPVNDLFVAARIRARGARGIYTSYLTPNTIPELFAPSAGPIGPAPETEGLPR